jgi:hypothetical protein
MFAGAMTPSPAPSIGLDVPRFEMYGALGTNVEVRYTLGPSRYHGEADPGPHVVSGTVAIVSGPTRTDSLFTFAQLGMVPPKQTQIVPHDVRDACEAFGAIAIESLAGYVAPAAVVTSVAIGKGCQPILHTFVPANASSRSYVSLPTYTLPQSFQPQHAAASAGSGLFHVVSVRTFTLPQSPYASPAHDRIAIAVGTGRDGRRSTIAFDLGAHAIPAMGSTYVLEPNPTGMEGVATPLAPA